MDGMILYIQCTCKYWLWCSTTNTNIETYYDISVGCFYVACAWWRDVQGSLCLPVHFYALGLIGLLGTSRLYYAYLFVFPWQQCCRGYESVCVSCRSSLSAQYMLQFITDHFLQTLHVSCLSWKKEPYWFCTMGSRPHLALYIKLCGHDTDCNFYPITRTFKLHI